MTDLSWVFYGLGAALCSALIPLIQEKHRAPPVALGIGIAAVLVVASAPMVAITGLPRVPAFYAAIIVMAAVWCISDVFYFRAVTQVGAGPVARILPSATIISFIAWFGFDPALLQSYLAAPVQASLALAAVLAATYFAMQLSRCAVSRRAVRLLIVPLLASVATPIALKLIMGTVNLKQAIYAYVLVNAASMLVFYSAYALAARRRDVLAALQTRALWLPALLIGAVNIPRQLIQNMGYAVVDHPSYLTVVLMTDALLVIGFYKLLGRRESANVAAGVGLVASAMALVLVKAL